MNEPKACSSCGRIAGPEDRFCGSCGQPLTEAAASQVARPALDAVFAHLRSGEQRPATILMADLSGYSSLGENADPEWVFHLINEVFEELGECLISHGGHIDKFIGDEIMALFGVPVAQEKSVERAVRSALAMHERLSVLNCEGRFGDVNLGIHTGINVGPVMVGPVGHRARSDYTVIGDAVNIAKRLEEEASEGEIYVSRAVRDSVAELFEFADVGFVSVSGRQQQVEVFRLLGTRTPAARHRLFVRVDTPFIGRDNELRELSHHAEVALSEGLSCVCVAGEPGIGKSRVLADWIHSSEQASDFEVVAVSCYPFGQHFPLLPLIATVAQLAGLRVEGWPPRVAGDIEDAVARLPVDPKGKDSLVKLLRCWESPPDDAQTSWREMLRDGISGLLGGISRAKPLCLMLEDIHWMDEASNSVLAEVMLQAERWPMFVLVSAREPGDAWAADMLRAHVIRLTPLPMNAIEFLVQEWVKPITLPADTLRAICDRSQGHPYFAHELVHGLRHGGVADIESDANLPNTLQELFLAQLDHLSLPLRRLVMAASVVGEPLSGSLLEAAMGDESRMTSALIAEAVRQGHLRPGPDPGQFVFERRLLFESAYSAIPPSRRKDLHARIATHLTDRLRDLGDAAIHTAAHHAYLGYHDERALDLLLQSARQYRAQYANRQAIQVASRVLELVGSISHPEAYLHQRLEALLFLAQSYEILGDLGHAEGTILEAEILAEDCTNPELAAQISTAAATLHLMQGRWSEAREQFSRAKDVWAQIGNEFRVAHALLGMGMCDRQVGTRERALQLFADASERGAEALWVRAAALNNAGVMLLEEGRYADAECYFSQGLLANEEDGDRRGLAHCKASLGELYLRQGRSEQAKRWLQESVDEAESIDDAECQALASALLARVLALQKHLDEARRILDQYEGVTQAANDPQVQPVVRLANFEVRRASGDWEGVLKDISAIQLDDEIAENLRSSPFANAVAETLCLGIEVALQHRQTPPVSLVATLQGIRGHIADIHLRQYADGLLSWLADRRVEPDSVISTETRDFWSNRFQRLLATRETSSSSELCDGGSS